jgi:hypothetical protein
MLSKNIKITARNSKSRTLIRTKKVNHYISKLDLRSTYKK